MNAKPKKNECWLLETPDPLQPRLQVLVLEIAENRKMMKVAPFFFDGDDALPEDRMLAAPCDFLGGERWLAAGLTEWAAESRFYKKIGAMPQIDVTCLLGNASRRGLPFLPGIGDAREKARDELRRELMQAAAATLVERVLVLGEAVVSAVEQLREKLAGSFPERSVAKGFSCMFAVGATPGSGLLYALSRLVSVKTPPVCGKGAAMGAVELDIGEAGVGLRLTPVDGGWILQLSSKCPAVEGTLVDGKGDEFGMESIGDQRLFGNPMTPIPPGECSLRWCGAGSRAWQAIHLALPAIPPGE